jgi:hypothetical protein
MFRKILLTGSIALFLSACGGNSTQEQSPAADGKAAVNVEKTTAPSPETTAKVKENNDAQPTKTIDNSPKRIVFNKGANWGAVNVALAAGAAQKFVVGARGSQIMSVESSSKDISINLLEGDAQTTEDFGFLRAELESNGDFVFEVRNSTKKEIKASVKVTIEDEVFQRGVLNDVDKENEKKEQDN